MNNFEIKVCEPTALSHTSCDHTVCDHTVCDPKGCDPKGCDPKGCDPKGCDQDDVVECPICMDAIDLNKNCVITECGHKFHTSCLMTNSSMNGFKCPNCRAIMAEEEDDEEEDEDDDESVDDEDELYTDYSLRGMRWLFQTVQGEELDNDDDDEDDEDEPQQQVPTMEHIIAQLQSRQISVDAIVRCLISSNYEGYYEHEHGNETLFELLDSIINETEPVAPALSVTSVTTPDPEDIDLLSVSSTDTLELEDESIAKFRQMVKEVNSKLAIQKESTAKLPKSIDYFGSTHPFDHSEAVCSWTV
jgi:hypothetical protein